ncbi:MAG TPA: 2-succinyl-5-enolpyruvyl-6-hydroxy-3-cyclohexene-1-carboxylic-acid synthase [Polyangiaceae bacterium]|nr:2-succinyl-5-enolpyruvyl-6-hydroxy-3-cyclohexene-1-carboxylic-acid synthase [Polyangiaceae bacterium]
MSAALVGQWSRLFARSLVQAGLEHAVICPGSRSTPFAWALAAERKLACHSLVDERAAAFFALGLARASGRPALVLCTSGSAAANFFPAVVEAALARLPLLVVTADRPLELQAAGAAQTIDQVKLYGAHVRAFFDLGTPDAAPSALGGLARTTAQAFALALGPEPGPVHLNARARKPLEPGPAETAAERALVSVVDGIVARGVTRVTGAERVPGPDAVHQLARALAGAARGVIVAGPLPLPAPGAPSAAAAWTELAERLALPFFAEATSGLRFDTDAPTSADGLEWLLRSRTCRAALAPDLVLRVGAVPTAGGLEPLLAEQPSAELHVVSEHGHPDALGRARTLTLGPPERVAAALGAALRGREPNAEQRAFAARVARANELVWQAVGHVTGGGTPLDEPQAVRLAFDAVPAGGLVVLGNSLPVRSADAFVRASARGLFVASQRGANGIDGLVAGAAGSALAAGVPTLLLLGDVSFLHDLGGLAAARLVSSPLALVVIDNDGGRIFETLPVEKLWRGAPERAELWLTPPKVAFEHAAALFDVPYAAPRSAGELSDALKSALARPGATLVHVRVPEHGARDAIAAVGAELERSVPSVLGAGAPA